VVPIHYSYWERGSKSLAIDMDVTGGDVHRLSVAPPVDPAPDRIPVTELHKRGILDPMSALLFSVRGNGSPLSPAACAQTLAIFDGRQRFDIELSYAGLREVHTPRGYRGPVVVCRAAYRPIAGHRAAKKEVRQVQANRSIEVWLAPVEGTRALLADGPPVGILTRGGDGAVVITAERHVAVSAPPIEVVDTIGAGDAFAGGFLAWWRERGLGHDGLADLDAAVDAARFACLVAARTCERPGASPPYRSEL
jgi:hypothetical protein